MNALALFDFSGFFFVSAFRGVESPAFGQLFLFFLTLFFLRSFFFF